jgi:tRNA 2-thiouridine synthesizing protein E
MPAFIFKGKTYDIDDEDFLLHPNQWDENFAEGMAPNAEVPGALTASHWDVIKFIRNAFSKTGKCPMVYETCKALRLRTADLSKLFPTGYLRGACKLAGLTYRAQEISPAWLPKERMAPVSVSPEDRVYRVNIRGFLIDPGEWDEEYAIFKAQEMKVPGELTEKHWEIIRFLREQYKKTGKIPTVYETCSAARIEIDQLGELFPDGYHRGAVKISGLRAL